MWLQLSWKRLFWVESCAQRATDESEDEGQEVKGTNNQKFPEGRQASNLSLKGELHTEIKSVGKIDNQANILCCRKLVKK